jgi:hypothetical protein
MVIRSLPKQVPYHTHALSLGMCVGSDGPPFRLPGTASSLSCGDWEDGICGLREADDYFPVLVLMRAGRAGVLVCR